MISKDWAGTGITFFDWLQGDNGRWTVRHARTERKGEEIVPCTTELVSAERLRRDTRGYFQIASQHHTPSDLRHNPNPVRGTFRRGRRARPADWHQVPPPLKNGYH